MVLIVLCFCAGKFFRSDAVLLREDFMASEVDKKWFWGSLKRNVVGAV